MNEFGRKKVWNYEERRKAMKIKWKEGISLKEAWKKVKKNKKYKSPQKKKKSKTSSKTHKAQAKKAMKLMWKEGISLKQAWKKVKKGSKFGDTVCPPGTEINKFWTGRRGQRQCINECGFYQMRDPTTNRCRNMTMVKQSKSIPPGWERNPETGRLRKICPVGYYRDPVSKRCRKIKPMLQPLMVPGAGPMMSEDLIDLRFGNAKNPVSRRCGFGTCSACSKMKFKSF